MTTPNRNDDRNAYLDQFTITQRYQDLCHHTNDPIVRLLVTAVDAIVRADDTILDLGTQITDRIDRTAVKIANRHHINNLGELQRTPVEYDQACAARQTAIEHLRHVAAAYRTSRTAPPHHQPASTPDTPPRQ